MWAVAKLEIQSRELDFSSSGMGRHSTTALLGDGVELVNALDLAEFSEPAQLTVCDHCGTVGCNSGDWAAFRRIGSGLAFIPCFAEMSDGGWESTEYVPPSFMNRKGIPFFSGEALSMLRAFVPYFGTFDRFPLLSGKEAVRIMQWEAPATILGQFPSEPFLNSDLVLAVNPGDDKSTIAVLTDLVLRAFASDDAIVLTDGDPMTLYLDLPGFPEWTPLSIKGEAHLLTLGAGVSFSIVGSTQPGVGTDGAAPRG